MFSAGRAGTAAFSASAHWRSSASSEAAEEGTPPVRTHPPHTHSGAHARHRVESRTASGDEVLVVLEGDERDRALAEVMLQGATDIVWRAGLLEVNLFSWVRVGGQKRSVHECAGKLWTHGHGWGKRYLARGSCSRSASPRWRHPRCERPPPAQRSLLPIVRFWFVGKVVGDG